MDAACIQNESRFRIREIYDLKITNMRRSAVVKHETKEAVKSGLVGGILGGVISGLLNYFICPFLKA